MESKIYPSQHPWHDFPGEISRLFAAEGMNGYQSCPETAIETLRRTEEISYSCKRKVQFEMEHSR